MNLTLLYILGYLVSVTVIVISGFRLSKYGDILADMLGWGKMFMGIILMAFVTSLPEMMIGISSVTIVGAPDLAVGDIVGSCAFNMLIISIMDLYYPRKSLIATAHTGHVIAAAFGIILLALVGFAILMPHAFGNIVWIGGFSIIFIILYLIAIRIVFLYEKKSYVPNEIAFTHKLSVTQVIWLYILHALLVILAALTLPFFGEYLAKVSGLGESFFGTFFIAISTSLPEIVVSFSAIRIGAIDMAMGNLFGSNIFNIGILALDDVLFTDGPIFLFTNRNHIIPVLGTIIITAIGISGIVFKLEKKRKLAIDTVVILLVYTLMMLLLYYKK